jgi:V/A-type H+-transporting ATPase subunit I
MLVLSKPLPGYINVLLVMGPALVILFNQPRKNILAGVGLGLGDFLLSVMGFFGDVISYIRLFAVGLAGVAVADTTNQMALSLGFNHIVSGFFAVLILLTGHLLNIVLSGFSILVHGIRLNILEFSMHLGVEWAGVAYQPFKIKCSAKGD